jgi:hypothetical protein
MGQTILAPKVSVNRKVTRKAIIDPPSTFWGNERLMRAGKMPRSLTRVEDWARAETFAKRTSILSGFTNTSQLTCPVLCPLALR